MRTDNETDRGIITVYQKDGKDQVKRCNNPTTIYHLGTRYAFSQESSPSSIAFG